MVTKKKDSCLWRRKLDICAKKELQQLGFKLNMCIVDDGSAKMRNKKLEDTPVIDRKDFDSSYSAEKDVVIWTISSPDVLHEHMADKSDTMECILFWNLCSDFWRDSKFADYHEQEFEEVCNMLHDDYSRMVLRAYVRAQDGIIDDDIRLSASGTYFNELTRGVKSGVFVDCGAYDGATSLAYRKWIDHDSKVYAFEPDPHNYKILLENTKDEKDFICIKKGCYSSEKKLFFDSRGDEASSVSKDGDIEIEVTTIDKVLGDDRVAFIKMDIEGAEAEALKGGKNVIERDMPILAISAYHRQEDLITLIPLISGYKNDEERYRLYLRHHGVSPCELVIYAIPERKG